MKILYILIPFVSAIIAGSVAGDKNRSGVGWAVLSFFFPIALIVLLFLGKKPNPHMSSNNSITSLNMKCPQCAEIIKREAKICRFCEYDVESWSKNQRVKVDPGHENLKPSNMLSTAYYYKNRYEQKKSLAYMKLIIEKYPNTEEAKAALSETKGLILNCPKCAELIDPGTESCEYCGNKIAPSHQ